MGHGIGMNSPRNQSRYVRHIRKKEGPHLVRNLSHSRIVQQPGVRRRSYRDHLRLELQSRFFQ